MGRKKLVGVTPYMDRTVNFATRCKKDSVERFLEIFHNEKAYRKSIGKSYFLNSAMEEMFNKYIAEYEAKAAVREEAAQLAKEREDVDVKTVLERALQALENGKTKEPYDYNRVVPYITVPKE